MEWPGDTDRSRIDHGIVVKPSVEGHESSSDDGDLRIFAVEVRILVGVEKDDPNIVIDGLVLGEGRVASDDAALAREHILMRVGAVIDHLGDDSGGRAVEEVAVRAVLVEVPLIAREAAQDGGGHDGGPV